MDNERAVEVIKNYVGCYLGFLSGEEYEAMELAIDALEENVIRMNTIEKWKKDFKEYVNGLSLSRDDYKGIMEYIDEVPTVETNIEVVAQDAYKQGYTDGWKERFGEPNERPQGEWIPVSEKLPNLDDYTGSEVWKKKVLITGYLSFDDTKNLFVSEVFAKDIICNRVHNTIVIAWQKLPEPYRKGGAE